MASNYVYLTGKCKWAKVYKVDDKYKNWQIQLYMDNASQAKFDASGMTMQSKQDEDGVYVTFRRPEAKLIKNELVKFDPPQVMDKDGNPFDGTIGNGSTVTIKVIVYDTIKGKGHRLEAVRVDNLIEYKKPEAASTEAYSAPAVAPASAEVQAKPKLRAVPF